MSPPTKSPASISPQPTNNSRSLNDELRKRLMNSQHFNDMASDKPMMDPPLQRWEQPRGGIIIETSIGNLQFGMPPETIKVREEEKNQTPEQLLLNTFYYI